MALNEKLDTLIPGALLMEPRETYDGAVIGTTFDGRAIYDSDLVIRLCVDHEGMSYEDAEEWHNYNTFCAYMGPKTPVYASVPFSVSLDDSGEE
jgi:hypothetical protein